MNSSPSDFMPMHGVLYPTLVLDAKQMVPTQFFNNCGMLEFAGVTCLNISALNGMRRGLHSLTPDVQIDIGQSWLPYDASIALIVTEIRNLEIFISSVVTQPVDWLVCASRRRLTDFVGPNSEHRLITPLLNIDTH